MKLTGVTVIGNETSLFQSDVSTEREPKAFRKVRQRLEATTAGIESKEETKDEECNGGVFGGVGGELDFMPLESDVGEFDTS